jgi:hypothetical protein
LKNPDSAENIAERQQSALLNSIIRVVNRDPPIQVVVADSTQMNKLPSGAASMVGNATAAAINASRMSPTSKSSNSLEDDREASLKSPAGMMSEASVTASCFEES